MAGKINKLALTVAYNFLRNWKKLTKTSTRGAAVAVWYEGQILVVRHSYRPGYSLPGGQIKRGEEPAFAAARELREEVGIQAEPECLISVHGDRSGDPLFEFHARILPDFKIDNREIIEARFLDPAGIPDPDDKLYLYLQRVTCTTPKNATEPF